LKGVFDNFNPQNGNIYHQKKSFPKVQGGVESLNSPMKDHLLKVQLAADV
jgi:hypothetical protein